VDKSINELNKDIFKTQNDEKFLDPQHARKKGMDFLALREYGYEELITKLQVKGYNHKASTQALEGLKRDGLQDDMRFAESFCRSRYKQGKGPLKIIFELKNKKLPRKIIDHALDDLDVDWFELAKEARLKKFGTMPVSDFKEKSRQMRFLQSRGFDADSISAALKI
jgi:regulatory protein|tara:strand:- start:86 stop:586 length:501 start_codon:yes stop_codon:yes gene_type:complete